jgi:hypothetical protein
VRIVVTILARRPNGGKSDKLLAVITPLGEPPQHFGDATCGIREQNKAGLGTVECRGSQAVARAAAIEMYVDTGTVSITLTTLWRGRSRIRAN